jgi:hypothetical protein
VQRLRLCASHSNSRTCFTTLRHALVEGRANELPLTMNTPTAPGIYVVTLRSDSLVPVTQDARYVNSCARVNCLNLKLGKARNLARRERDYLKDFGRGNVLFTAIATTHDIVRAETAILRRLGPYRKPSPKGGKMEWLENLGLADAIRLAREALDHEGVQYERL